MRFRDQSIFESICVISLVEPIFPLALIENNRHFVWEQGKSFCTALFDISS